MLGIAATMELLVVFPLYLFLYLLDLIGLLKCQLSWYELVVLLGDE